MAVSVFSVLSRFLEEYVTRTPSKIKIIDAYLLYILLTGAFQFLYCLLVGTFPFNSFLAGFISCVGSFILAGEFSGSTDLGFHVSYIHAIMVLLKKSKSVDVLFLSYSMPAHSGESAE